VAVGDIFIRKTANSDRLLGLVIVRDVKPFTGLGQAWHASFSLPAAAAAQREIDMAKSDKPSRPSEPSKPATVETVKKDSPELTEDELKKVSGGRESTIAHVS